jgi:hypothetical protein
MNEQVTKLMDVSQFQHPGIDLQIDIYCGFENNQLKGINFLS